MAQKKCFKCNQIKQLDDFYKHSQMADGHLNKCKECTKRDVQENYQARHEQYILYDRLRLDTEARQASIRRNNEKRKSNSAYQKQRRETIRRYRKNNPEKHKAHIIVNNAVRNGQITKGFCEVCGSSETQAHHEDYSQPLLVRWLCPKHHGNQHRKSRKVA